MVVNSRRRTAIQMHCGRSGEINHGFWRRHTVVVIWIVYGVVVHFFPGRMNKKDFLESGGDRRSSRQVKDSVVLFDRGGKRGNVQRRCKVAQQLASK